MYRLRPMFYSQFLKKQKVGLQSDSSFVSQVAQFMPWVDSLVLVASSVEQLAVIVQQGESAGSLFGFTLSSE